MKETLTNACLETRNKLLFSTRVCIACIFATISLPDGSKLLLFFFLQSLSRTVSMTMTPATVCHAVFWVSLTYFVLLILFSFILSLFVKYTLSVLKSLSVCARIINKPCVGSFPTKVYTLCLCEFIKRGYLME